MAITQAHSRMVSDVDAGNTYVAASQLGTSANNVVQLTAAAKLPAVDGSLLTGITDNGKVLQQVHASTAAVVTGTTAMVADDTIPQNTEGNEAITLAITPTSAASKLLITANVFHSVGETTVNVVIALFQDSTANALAAVGEQNVGSTYPMTTTLTHRMTAGTTSATTFKIRAGAATTNTWTLNGWGGARKLGGVASTTLTITELSA